MVKTMESNRELETVRRLARVLEHLVSAKIAARESADYSLYLYYVNGINILEDVYADYFEDWGIFA